MSETPPRGAKRPKRPPVDPKALDSNRRRYKETWDAVAEALSSIEAQPEHMASALRWMATEIGAEGFVKRWDGSAVTTPDLTTDRAKRNAAALETQKRRARFVAGVAHRWQVCLKKMTIHEGSRGAAIESLKVDGFGDWSSLGPIETLGHLALEATMLAEELGCNDLFTEAYGRKTLEQTLRAVKHQDGESIYTGDIDETMRRAVSWATNESPFETAKTARRLPVEQSEQGSVGTA